MSNNMKKFLITACALICIGVFVSYKLERGGVSEYGAEYHADLERRRNSTSFTSFDGKIDAAPLRGACVYFGPNLETGTCFKELDNGTIVKVIGVQGGAYRIEYEGLSYGWTLKEWVVTN